MNDLELTWLVPTALQVMGMAIALGVIGFGYEQAGRERKSILEVLEGGDGARWLAGAGVIFTVGICFTQMGWGSKAIAIILAGLLVGLAWTSPRMNRAVTKKYDRQKPSLKSIAWLVVKIYLGIFLLLVLVWGLVISWHAVHLYGLARDLGEDPSQIQVESIPTSIQEAAKDVGAIHKLVSPLFPVFDALQGIPWAGAYLGQVEPVLTYADGLAQAGEEISLGLGPLLEEPSADQMELTLPERASQVFQLGQEHFGLADKAIEQASWVREQIRAELLPEAVRSAYLKLDEKFHLLQAGVKILQIAAQLSGSDQAQTYLILAQNRDELRATGGFISGIGLLSVEDGKITQFNLRDSYEIDDFSKAYPTPPEPIHRFMLADYWVTRDANWSPDFPTAAQQAQTLYTLSTGIETQGVIAFNQLAIQKVLEVIGAVEVPGTDEPVTAGNVEEYMRQAWAPAPEEGLSEEWWLHRKDFMQQLGIVMLNKVLTTGDQEQLLDLAKAMVDLLEQGQLLVFFNDPKAQSALELGGWNGALHPGNNDYLYLVDANVGFNKVDSVIQRSLTYQVDLSDLNRPTGKVTVTYQHTGSGDPACKQMVSYGNGTYKDMQQRCYLDFWRIYVPAGAELLSSNAKPVPADQLLNGQGWSGQVESLTGEAGSQVFAGILMVPPAQASKLEISYSLPNSIVKPVDIRLQMYELSIQVQPGLVGLPFQLEIFLPEHASVVNPGEGWESVTAEAWTWQGVLDRSTQLSLSFQTNTSP